MTLMQKQYQKILRTLMKNPSNRKCADCGEQCPVNVDTTHGIFVCASCSGIHREFGDRIKSVSMATFTQDEITLLQKQTNDDFNKIFMAKWNPQEDPLPLNVDDNRKRAFLQLKYIQKIWYSKVDDNNHNQEVKPKQVQNNNNKTNIFVQNQPFQNKNEQSIQNQWTNQIQNIPSHHPIQNNNKNNDISQSQNSNNVDLLDFDCIPQPVKNQNQTENIQQTNNLIDFGENQNNAQNSSRQELKSFIEEMNQSTPTVNSFNNFNNDFGRMNVQNDVRYHFTQPRSNRTMFAANYRTGGFGGDIPKYRINNTKLPNNANYFGNSFGVPSTSIIPPKNGNCFQSNGNF